MLNCILIHLFIHQHYQIINEVKVMKLLIVLHRKQKLVMIDDQEVCFDEIDILSYLIYVLGESQE
jgi:hypothetical protein